jgi:hypothetical protein
MNSVRRYTSLGRLLEDAEPDREAFFVHFDDHRDRIRELEEWQHKRTKITGQVIDETVTLEARIRELEAALREAIAQMESDVVFHEYDRGHRSISEMPDNDLPDALLHARATLNRGGEHE